MPQLQWRPGRNASSPTSPADRQAVTAPCIPVSGLFLRVLFPPTAYFRWCPLRLTPLCPPCVMRFGCLARAEQVCLLIGPKKLLDDFLGPRTEEDRTLHIPVLGLVTRRPIHPNWP